MYSPVMALVYSCCFWFSLRLGGILIGFFSMIQAVVVLIVFCIASQQIQNVKDQISLLTKNLNLIYTNAFFDNFQADPEKYIAYAIVIVSIYIFVCVLYIYGAYMLNNAAMFGYILIEFVRLITISTLVIMWLLVLKQNTMDIGLVIGASVTSGFILLGMFYLWTCAASLPILINEMEHDKQTATIKKLQRLLETKEPRLFKSSLGNDTDNLYRRQLYVISRNNLIQGS